MIIGNYIYEFLKYKGRLFFGKIIDKRRLWQHDLAQKMSGFITYQSNNIKS